MNKLILQGIILAVIVSALGGVLYQWHYKPLKKYHQDCIIKNDYIKKYKFQIHNLKQKVENGKVLLQKCKDDANVKVFETEFGVQGDQLDDLYTIYLQGEKNETKNKLNNNTNNKYKFTF
jgi:hypothetical protein